MDVQQRVVRLITYSSWFFLILGSLLSFMIAEPLFARGVVLGGLIVTINFHILGSTLKKSLKLEFMGSYNIVLIKYYIRFAISGAIILLLIQQKIVSPFGLFIGLSVLVVSVVFAAVIELKKIIFKEAV